MKTAKSWKKMNVKQEPNIVKMDRKIPQVPTRDIEAT